jgi:hypothetical protein
MLSSRYLNSFGVNIHLKRSGFTQIYVSNPRGDDVESQRSPSQGEIARSGRVPEQKPLENEQICGGESFAYRVPLSMKMEDSPVPTSTDPTASYGSRTRGGGLKTGAVSGGLGGGGGGHCGG